MFENIVPVITRNILGSRSIMLFGDNSTHVVQIIIISNNGNNGLTASQNGLILPVLFL